MIDIITKLAEGDMRVEGRSMEVAQDVIADSDLLETLLAAMQHDEKTIRMRAFLSFEMIARTNPELVLPHFDAIMDLVATPLPEYEWHTALFLDHFELSVKQLDRAVQSVLDHFHESKSSISKANSIVTLSSIVERTGAHRKELDTMLKEAMENGPAAARVKARRILEKQ